MAQCLLPFEDAVEQHTGPVLYRCCASNISSDPAGCAHFTYALKSPSKGKPGRLDICSEPWTWIELSSIAKRGADPFSSSCMKTCLPVALDYPLKERIHSIVTSATQ